jgi:hypothetical protein
MKVKSGLCWEFFFEEKALSPALRGVISCFYDTRWRRGNTPNREGTKRRFIRGFGVVFEVLGG